MSTTSHAKRLARVAAAAALAATVLVGPLALSSSAANFTADSEATWRAALADAEANTGETNVITLTGDFVMNDPIGNVPTYTGVDDLIIDGNGHTVSATPGNQAAFFRVNSAFGEVSLHDLTLTGFRSSDGFVILGAWAVDVFNLTVRDFDGQNSAVYLSAQDVTIEDSTFTNNASSPGDAGALYVSCTNEVSILTSAFSGNSGDSGGAVFTECPTYIDSSTFTDNSAMGRGGAFYTTADVRVYDSVFSSNTAGFDGGAVFAQTGAYMETSTFTGNEAGAGGAVYVGIGGFGSSASTFSNNTAAVFGGGVYAFDYVDSFESTWVGNEAAVGGAIFTVNNNGFADSQMSTFIDNYASVVGGAIYAQADDVRISNSVFTGNGAGTDGSHVYVNSDELFPFATVFDGGVGPGGCYAGSGTDSNGYNFDDDGTCTGTWSGVSDFGNGADPRLGPLAENGGPTRTRQPLPTSPLIDAIPWVACDSLAADSYDQRFVERVDTGADVDGCDIGSVEVITDLSFDIVGSSGTTTVTVTGALDYDCDAWTSIAGYVPAPPAGIAFPHGVFQYCFDVPSNGATVTITLTLPSPVNTLWKETGGVWSEVTGVVFAGTTVTYNVTDGGALDEDGIVNGYIIDPIAAGRRAGFTG